MRYLCLVFFSILISGSGAIAQSRFIDAVKDESFATYKLVHPLHEVESTSKVVAFRIEFDSTVDHIKAISASADVTSFDSGNSNRDSHAMEVIDAITYPDVTFQSTAVRSSGDSLTVSGKLTFHGVTNDVVASLTRQWSPDKARVEFDGGFPVSLTAFKIDRPSLLMIPVEDTLRFTLKAVFNLK